MHKRLLYGLSAVLFVQENVFKKANIYLWDVYFRSKNFAMTLSPMKWVSSGAYSAGQNKATTLESTFPVSEEESYMIVFKINK